MSTRVFTDPRPSIKLSDGVTPNALGKVYFYEPGAGNTTLKSAYTDSSLTVSATNPVVLNGSGQTSGAIYLDGDYRVVIKTSAEVTLYDTPSYQASEVDAQFDDWVAYEKYSIGDFARASGGNYYESRKSENIGNDPTISNSYWKRAFVGPYSEWIFDYPYSEGSAVTYNGAGYISQLSGENVGNTPSVNSSAWYQVYYSEVYNSNRQYFASNNKIVKYLDDFWLCTADTIGNTPSASSPYWRSFFFPAAATDFTATSFEYRFTDGYINPPILSVHTIASFTWQSIGATGSGAANIWSALDSIPSNAKSAIVRAEYYLNRSSTTDASCTLNMSARHPDGSAAALESKVFSCGGFGGSASNDFNFYGSDEFTVPTKDGSMFDIYWAEVNQTDATIFLFLVGYKS